jgi:hypothetical protein
MEIIDIQKVKQGISEKFEITFDDGNAYDGVKIIMSKEDMWQIAHYCMDELSYGVNKKQRL